MAYFANRNTLAWLRNAGSYFALKYCRSSLSCCVLLFPITVRERENGKEEEEEEFTHHQTSFITADLLIGQSNSVSCVRPRRRIALCAQSLATSSRASWHTLGARDCIPRSNS